MTLPTTSLSFSALQTEYGGSNPISLSEYYRGGSFVPSGQTGSYGTIPTSGTINIGVFRGTTKSSLLDTQTVTVGGYEFFEGPPTGYYEKYYGYGSQSGGSISDGTSNIYGGSGIAALQWYDVYGGGSAVELLIYGVNPNSGWTTMNIAGYTYNRASASFYQSGGITFWTWVNSFTNPFGTTIGATKTVTWT